VGEQPKPFVSERLAASLVSAIRLLDAADRALASHDATLANVVLGFEPDARVMLGPGAGAVRGDAAVESILDLAMRVADLARVAWRPDRVHPEHADVAALRDDIDAVRSQAALAIAGGIEELPALTRFVARADVHTAAMARACDRRRYACLAF
jgi:hypothetical protein